MNHAVPREAMRMVAELICFGAEYVFFRGSAETSSGNKVDVWKEYPEKDGVQAEEYRWRVWTSLNDFDGEKILLAKGVVVTGSDEFLAITKLCHELNKIDRMIVSMEEELKRLSTMEASKCVGLYRLNFGRVY